MPQLNHVKLIVTDMDGTLLNSHGEIPDEFFTMLPQFQEKNISVAIASGRPYPTLRRQFGQHLDALTLIAENGSCIIAGEKPVFTQSLSSSEVSFLDTWCQRLQAAAPLFSCLNGAYILKNTPVYIADEIHRYYKSLRKVESVDDITEPVLKVAICDLQGAEHNSYQQCIDIPAPFKATLAGQYWTDLALSDTNKGNAVKALQSAQNISYDETMLFGDYLNDYEMMSSGYFSFAMANAHPDLKKISRFEAPGNDQNGVIHVLRQLLSET